MYFFNYLQIKQWVAGVILGGLWILLGFSVGAIPAQAASKDCPKYYFNTLIENDLFGGGSDKHFTQGARFSFVEARPRSFTKKFEGINNRTDLTDEAKESQKWKILNQCLKEREQEGHAVATAEFHRAAASLGRKLGNATIKKWLDFDIDAVSFIFGQDMFTPENITSTQILANDRPFAGWLYFGWGFITERDPIGGPEYQVGIIDSFELDLGIIGPQAYAGEIQDWWHRNISNSPRPGGWPHQLKNEPGILMTLERKWRMPIPPFHKDDQYFQFDVLPSAGGALGNVFTYAGLGATLRVGHNLQNDYGPPRNRPSAQGADFFPAVRKGKFYWYFFFGVEGRVVVRNIFLDGNTFTDSHRVDKKGVVGDVHAGVVIAYKCLRIAVTEVIRSEEFEQQKEKDEFGGISISLVW